MSVDAMTPDQLQWVLDHNEQIRGGHRAQIADAVEAWRADRGQRDELLAVLEKAVQIIRTWHGMGMGPAEAQAWTLYQASPEMRAINVAIQKAQATKEPSTGAEGS